MNSNDVYTTIVTLVNALAWILAKRSHRSLTAEVITVKKIAQFLLQRGGVSSVGSEPGSGSSGTSSSSSSGGNAAA